MLPDLNCEEIGLTNLMDELPVAHRMIREKLGLDGPINFFLTKQVFFVAILIVLFFFSFNAFAEKTVNILIVSNSNDKPYQDAIAGYKEQLTSGFRPNFVEFTLAQAKALSTSAIESLKPQLIYALGNDSAIWASRLVPAIPVVSTMVLREDVFKKLKNITGVSLSYPLKTQFRWLKNFFPQKKDVAVLYNPSENADTVRIAKEIGSETGFNLVAIPVLNPKELPYALEQLADKIELLLAIPDETVMSTNTAKEVLLASFRNKVPLIGLSDNWVKSGAFYALSWDYVDLGRQTGVMSQKLLEGAPLQSVSPEYPRKVTYTINAKIAEHMNMEIPEDILKNAKMVFN